MSAAGDVGRGEESIDRAMSRSTGVRFGGEFERSFSLGIVGYEFMLDELDESMDDATDANWLSLKLAVFDGAELREEFIEPCATVDEMQAAVGLFERVADGECDAGFGAECEFIEPNLQIQLTILDEREVAIKFKVVPESRLGSPPEEITVTVTVSFPELRGLALQLKDQLTEYPVRTWPSS